MSSLNAVVNSLVRAAAAIPNEISDEDLDRHVAKLLADEAKAKEKTWNELGLGAYLGRSEPEAPDPNAPKPNKRFLAAVIRNVDGHNASVLRAQAQGVREARDERRGSSGSPRSGERGDGRRERAGPIASAGAAGRLFGGAMSGLGQTDRARERRRRGQTDQRDGRDEGRNGDRSEKRRESGRDRADESYDDFCRDDRDARRQRDGERYDREERRRDGRPEFAARSAASERSPRSSRRARDDAPRAGPSRLRGWSDGDEEGELLSDDQGTATRAHPDEGDDGGRVKPGRHDDRPVKTSRSHRAAERSRSRDRDRDRDRDRKRRHRDDSSDRSDRKRRDRDAERNHRAHEKDSDRHHSSRRSVHSPVRAGRDKDRSSRYDLELDGGSAQRRHRHDQDETTTDDKKEYYDPDDPSRSTDPPKPRRRNTPSPSPPPPPPPPEEPPPPSPDFSPPRPQKLSKMDRYFQSSYDPRLDVGDVPKDGPVLAVGWDNMLAVMKERGSKRRKNSPDLFDEHDDRRSRKATRGASPDDLDTRNFEDFERKRKKEKKKKLGLVDEEDEEERKRRKERKKREADAEAMGLDAKGVMGIKYMPRGGMREWDMGKET